jgi:parallel beta-helix repeat protein
MIMSNISETASGGGVYMYHASCILSNSFISNNVATNQGGGIYLFGGTVQNCIIARNYVKNITAYRSGGGILLRASASSLIQDCIIDGNYCYGGGGAGIGADNAINCVIRNCLIKNNCAFNGNGGGVYLRSHLGVISGCTIVSNYAYAQGGGIGLTSTSGGNLSQFENCIIYFNACDSAAYSNYYLWKNGDGTFTNCCLSPAFSAAVTNINTVTNNPQFVNLANENYHLSQGSPCINAGMNRDWMNGAVDLDGHGRLDRYSGIVDMGCFEYLPAGSMYRFGF